MSLEPGPSSGCCVYGLRVGFPVGGDVAGTIATGEDVEGVVTDVVAAFMSVRRLSPRMGEALLVVGPLGAPGKLNDWRKRCHEDWDV
jgi:hypothetical protein